MDLAQIGSVLLLVLGFGFVIFWHELGHFLAAKWAGVKVEQFAVGFGQALLAWRKGIGVRVGTTQPEYEQRVRDYVEANRKPDAPDPTDLQAATALGIGETEYRLNWIPLGGYVKMLGQDDLNPNALAEDPRSYNKQTIFKRMVIVSAGVVMNIILAAIGFMALFLIGFDAPPAIIGAVSANSPAAKTVRADDGALAPLQVGDRVLEMDGAYQYDFTKIMLNTALLEEGAKVPLLVQRRDGTKEHLFITPSRLGGPKGLLMLGVGQPQSLRAAQTEVKKGIDPTQMVAPELLALKPGDTVVAVNGQAVGVNEYYKLDDVARASQGKPITLTVAEESGAKRQVTVQPHLDTGVSTAAPGVISFAGMVPRASVREIKEGSPALGKLMPGDVITSIDASLGSFANPSAAKLMEWLDTAGQSGKPVNLKVLRGDQSLEFKGIVPSVKVNNGKRGLNVLLIADELHAVVADVNKDSPAALANIPAGSTIDSIAGQPVKTWFDVQTLLGQATPGKPVDITVTTSGGDRSTHQLTLDADQVATLAGYRPYVELRLKEISEPRKTSSPLVAAKWGVQETRDFILQFYLTLKRMAQGSIPVNQMMGPVGIFTAGTKLAYKGLDWLLWFLSMISANLAVVNFLPIPIVDGGLFTFLIIEKLRGKPLSPYAQQVAQFVGLAVLLGVFLLVTYQDIARLF